MKHMLLRFSSVLMLSATLFLASCSKGDDGPAGEKGEKGDKGDAGATGKAGTANVIYSQWKDVQFAQLAPIDPTDPTEPLRFRGVMQEAKITADIVSNGMVKVYANIGSAANPAAVALPFVDGFTLLGISDLVINPAVTAGGIVMISSYNTSSDPSDGFLQYRYVIIPGGTAARTAVNWNDYNQVKNYLGLKD